MTQRNDRALAPSDLLTMIDSLGGEMSEIKTAIAQLGRTAQEQQGLARMRTLWQDDHGSFAMDWAARKGSKTWTQIEEMDPATGHVLRRIQQDRIEIGSD